MWLTLWRKNGFVNIYPLLLIWSKIFFKQIQILFRIFSFSNMVRKTYFLSISVLVSEIVTFMSKKNSFLWIRFDWFDPKHLLKQIQIFLWIYPFSNMVRKRNSLSISVLVSEIVILCLEIKVLYEFLQKCLKTTERHSLAVCGLLCG